MNKQSSTPDNTQAGKEGKTENPSTTSGQSGTTGKTPVGGRENEGRGEGSGDRTGEERRGPGLGDQSGKQGGATGGQLGKKHDAQQSGTPERGTPRPDHATEEQEGNDPKRTQAEGGPSQTLGQTGGDDTKKGNAGKPGDRR